MSDGPDASGLHELLTTSLLHDLKNQAHHLAVGLQALEAAPGSEARLAALRAEAAALGDSLTDTLLLLRLSQRRYALRETLMPVRQLLEDVVAECALCQAGDAVRHVVEADTGLTHFLDETLVLSVLRSACDNALRHARGQVLLSARMVDDMLELNVEDDGPGYDGAADSGEAAVDRSRRRTGLGLELAREVAAAHRAGNRRGSVRLGRSGRLGGALFCLRLP